MLRYVGIHALKTDLSFRCLALTWVIWPLEKSNTSSLSSFRMTMLFWQRLSLVRLAPTMSLMKVGQCLGHSCFRICRRSGHRHVSERWHTLCGIWRKNWDQTATPPSVSSQTHFFLLRASHSEDKAVFVKLHTLLSRLNITILTSLLNERGIWSSSAPEGQNNVCSNDVSDDSFSLALMQSHLWSQWTNLCLSLPHSHRYIKCTNMVKMSRCTFRSTEV